MKKLILQQDGRYSTIIKLSKKGELELEWNSNETKNLEGWIYLFPDAVQKLKTFLNENV